LRFDSTLPDDAIFGIVFEQFKADYSNTANQLPILQLPAQIRNQDPNLKFSPHYIMQNEYFTMQIGPKVMSLANINEYQGWSVFQEKILDTFARFKKLNIFGNVNRIALRYINVFSEMDIFEASDVKVMLGSDELDSNNINLSTQIERSSITSTFKVISGAQAQIGTEMINGSIIDIDSSISEFEMRYFSSYLDSIHDEEKRIFYKIIGDVHIQSLNPEY